MTLGADLLRQAGCDYINAFRAGTFGANDQTLAAVENNKIAIDSSYNYCMEQCEITGFNDIQQPIRHDGIIEAPMSTFTDGLQHRRHAQLTACSYAELKASLNQAHNQQWNTYVLLSHSSELLKPKSNKYDQVVVRRFEKLCAYLANNTHQFITSSFADLQIDNVPLHPTQLKVGLVPTMQRYVEQSLRKIN